MSQTCWRLAWSGVAIFCVGFWIAVTGLILSSSSTTLTGLLSILGSLVPLGAAYVVDRRENRAP